MLLTLQFAHFITCSISHIPLKILLPRKRCSSTTGKSVVVRPVVPVHVLYAFTAVAQVPNPLAAAEYDAGIWIWLQHRHDGLKKC